MEDTLVKEFIVTEDRSPVKGEVRSALEEVLRMDIQKLLRAAIENKEEGYVERYSPMTDENGH